MLDTTATLADTTIVGEKTENEQNLTHHLYKGGIAKCAAIQIVFEYFTESDQIKMQILNKKFYRYIIPSIVLRVDLNR